MNRKRKERIFNEKIEPEYKRVFNFIYSRLERNRELSEDVTQETMEIAWNKLDQLQNIDSSRSWLMQIAMNEIRKYYRAQSTRKRGDYHEESYDLHEFEGLENLNNIEKDVLDTIIANEEQALLMDALNRVKENYRVLFDLRFIQDLKFAQIANIVQIDESIARVYYGRGIKMLDKEYRLLKGEGRKSNG